MSDSDDDSSEKSSQTKRVRYEPASLKYLRDELVTIFEKQFVKATFNWLINPLSTKRFHPRLVNDELRIAFDLSTLNRSQCMGVYTKQARAHGYLLILIDIKNINCLETCARKIQNHLSLLYVDEFYINRVIRTLTRFAPKASYGFIDPKIGYNPKTKVDALDEKFLLELTNNYKIANDPILDKHKNKSMF